MSYLYKIDNLDRGIEYCEQHPGTNRLEITRLTLLLAIVERLEALVKVVKPSYTAEQVLGIVHSCKSSSNQNPSELECAIMNLAAELEGAAGTTLEGG